MLTIDGERVGNQLNDNAVVDDGYRFHDVMHLTHVALLGWSPTIRGLMHRKRKSDPLVDYAEDGARAIIVDEAIVEMVFDYARGRDFLDGVDRVDYELLRTIRRRTSGLEVGVRSRRSFAAGGGLPRWWAIPARRAGTPRPCDRSEPHCRAGPNRTCVRTART